MKRAEPKRPRENVETDRVRKRTARRANREIDRRTRASLLLHSHEPDGEVARRIQALEKEWDVERVLMVNASTLALAGLALGLTVDRKWFALPGVVLPFLLQHSVQGWCPPLPVLRRVFGFRTRREIDRERYALKALRGDFEELGADGDDLARRIDAVLEAVGRTGGASSSS